MHRLSETSAQPDGSSLVGSQLDRFHLVTDVIDRVPRLRTRASASRQQMVDERLRHRAYTREAGDDPPDVRSWTWPHRSPAVSV